MYTSDQPLAPIPTLHFGNIQTLHTHTQLTLELDDMIENNCYAKREMLAKIEIYLKQYAQSLPSLAA